MIERKVIEIRGNPTPQARHRHRIRGKGKKAFAQPYDPSSDAKDDFLLMVLQHAPKVPWAEPLRVDMYFYMARPKNHYGTGRNAGKLKDWAPHWHTSKPDKDNLEKLVMDALKGRFWRDDTIVCCGWVEKVYDEVPRTVIIIESPDMRPKEVI